MRINLEQLDKLCKSDQEKKRRYLLQFLELVPAGMQKIKLGLKKKDFETVRGSIHFLAPQLAFFGLPEFVDILKAMQSNPEALSSKPFRTSLEKALTKIEKATTEVKGCLSEIANEPNK